MFCCLSAGGHKGVARMMRYMMTLLDRYVRTTGDVINCFGVVVLAR
jgi:hypothetical protein